MGRTENVEYMSDVNGHPAGAGFYEALVERLRDYDACHDGDVDDAADAIERLIPLHELQNSLVGGERPGDTLIRMAGLIRAMRIDDSQLTVSDWVDWLRDFGQRLNDA